MLNLKFLKMRKIVCIHEENCIGLPYHPAWTPWSLSSNSTYQLKFNMSDHASWYCQIVHHGIWFGLYAAFLDYILCMGTTSYELLLVSESHSVTSYFSRGSSLKGKPRSIYPFLLFTLFSYFEIINQDQDKPTKLEGGCQLTAKVT